MDIGNKIGNYSVEEFEIESVSELNEGYGNTELNQITYNIIGAAMEVHNTIGRGFLEVVYKDCLSIEFELKFLNFAREKKYEIFYKGIKIPRHYNADFVVEDKIVVEIKAQNMVIEDNMKQLINYLAVSKCKVGLLINFGENSLKYKRVILT